MKNKALAQILSILGALLIGLAASAEKVQVSPEFDESQKAHYENARANYQAQITNSIQAISQKSQKELLSQKQAGVPTNELKLKKCDSEYSTVLDKRDDTGAIYIHVGFGYINAKLSITEDLIAFEKLHEQLLKPCPTRRFALAQTPNQAERSQVPLHQLCGFEKTSAVFESTGRSRLTKTISLSNGEQKKVILDIATSSVTDNDYVNRHARRNEQEAKSFVSSEEFYKSLGNSNVVMYIGHSRDGGGPDFSLSVLKKGFEDQKVIRADDPVNYDYYRKNPEKIEKMGFTLANARHKPGIIGLFSCQAQNHFVPILDEVLNDSTRLFVTKELTDKPFQTFLISLNAVLSLQCNGDLTELMNQFNGAVFQPY